MIFKIPGIAVPQGRPRFFSGAFSCLGQRKVRVYDPVESKKWKELVRLTAIAAGCKRMTGPLSMELVFFLPAPKDLAKKLEMGKDISHIKKPDCSNLAKGVEDALEGICYDNDSQIVKLVVFKHYALVETYVLVTIREEKHAPEEKGGVICL